MSEEKKDKLSRVIPPLGMFEEIEKKELTHAVGPNQLVTPTYRVELPEEGGVLSWHVGDKYPTRAWPFKEAVFAIDVIKRGTLNLIKFAIRAPQRYVFGICLLFFLLLPKHKDSWRHKIIRYLIELYTEWTQIVFDRFGQLLTFEDEEGQQFGIRGVTFHPKFYCDIVREIYRVGIIMCGDDEVKKAILRVVCMILEFDDGYRYRFQDIMSLINIQAMLKNPAKETRRVLEIGAKRGKGTEDKIRALSKGITFLFWISEFKDMWLTFFKQVDIQKLTLDLYDSYRCLLWGGYEFMGIPDEDRASLRMMIDAEWTHGEKQKNAQSQTA